MQFYRPTKDVTCQLRGATKQQQVLINSPMQDYSMCNITSAIQNSNFKNKAASM